MSFPIQLFDIMVVDDDEHTLHSKLKAFTILILFHVTVSHLLKYNVLETSIELVNAILLATIFLLFISNIYPKLSLYAASLIMCIELYLVFPKISNHFLIEFLAIILITLSYRTSKDNDVILCQMLRWLLFVTLFYSGVQKLVGGTYFNGSFFIFNATINPCFFWFFSKLVSADTINMIQSPGPYLVDSPLIVALSNGVYIAEIIAALLLLHRKYYKIAIALTFSLIIGIEIVARELLFGCLFLNLLLLYIPGNWNKRCLPYFIIFYGLMIISQTLNLGIYFS